MTTVPMSDSERQNWQVVQDGEFIRKTLNYCGTTDRARALRVMRSHMESGRETFLFDGDPNSTEEGSPVPILGPLGGANARQVGGKHYESELQHWDVIERYGIGYLEGCSSKYVTRARKKNGLQDVEKCEHYIEKLIEMNSTFGRGPRGSVPEEVVLQFIQLNKLDHLEGAICLLLLTWSDVEELKRALFLVHRLLVQLRAAPAPQGGQ